MTQASTHASSNSSEERDYTHLRCAVFTASDTRTPEDDVSGDKIVSALEAAGHVVCTRGIIREDLEALSAQLSAALKGDQHEVFHNTCFDNARIDILLPRNRLPGKTKELVKQNQQTKAFNNWSRLTGSWIWEKPKASPYGIQENNQPAERSDFRDVPGFDFRPRTGSAAIDAGISSQGSQRYPVHGNAPDLGAYETGQPPWQAGYQTGSQQRDVSPPNKRK